MDLLKRLKPRQGSSAHVSLVHVNLLMFVAGEAAMPDEHSKHPRVLRETLHYKRCFFCQRALSASSELHAVQHEPTLRTA